MPMLFGRYDIDKCLHVFKFKRKLQLENQFTSKQKMQVRERKITRNVKNYKRQI